jgi:membrane protease subunit HflK
VGNRLGSDVLTVGRVDVALRAREEMQRILDIYGMGVHVSGVELQDVTPPDPVKPAFNEVNEARQEKERLVNLAEKERNQVIPRAQGEAAQTLSEAEAYTAERTNQAKGEAARFTAILTEYAKAPDVTRQRLYLEMLDTVLPKSNVYVIDKDAAGPLPLLDLTRRTSGSEK